METKFDFEDENLEKDIKKNASGLFNGILIFIQSVFRFNNDIDKNATINSIKNDISMRVCYEKIGAYDKAINHLNEIISKDPLYEKAWISIAKHYLRKNDHDKALENLNKALNIIANNY